MRAKSTTTTTAFPIFCASIVNRHRRGNRAVVYGLVDTDVKRKKPFNKSAVGTVFEAAKRLRLKYAQAVRRRRTDAFASAEQGIQRRYCSTGVTRWKSDFRNAFLF